MTGRRRRSPANHKLTSPDQPRYVWEGPAEPGVWACSCGAYIPGQDAAERHLTDRAKAALGRLDDIATMAVLAVSDVGAADARNATDLVYATRGWYGHPQLRKRIVAFYDSWGCLAARLDWPALAADLEAGTLTAEPEVLLVLRVAVSLTGVEIPLRLTDLLRLGDLDARNVRTALLKVLPAAADVP